MQGKKTAPKKKRSVTSKSEMVSPRVGVAEARPESPGKNYVGVDFPQLGEILTSPQYAIRISTSATEGVELSVDGKEWQPCRESVGFWWHDWSGFGAGVHTVVARILVGKRYLKSKAHSFTAII